MTMNNSETIELDNLVTIGRMNLRSMYAYTATSRLWFDGSLWLLYWQHKGISLFDVGLLEAILHIVCLATDVPIGIFADRFGWKIALVLSSLFGVLYCGLSLLGSGFMWAALAFAARGVQVTLTSGSDMALTYESARWAGLAEKYQRISGRLMAIMLISMAVAEATGGALAGWSWDGVYIAFAMANLISAFVILRVKEPRFSSHKSRVAESGGAESAVPESGISESAVPESAWKIAKDAVRFARQSPLFLRWLLFSAMLSGFVATFSFYGQSLLLHNGWSLFGIGILSGVENGFGAVMAVLSDRVTRLFGERATTVFTALLGSAGLLLFAFVPGLASGVGYLTSSASGNLADPLIDKELNEIIPSKQRATLLSANSTAFSLFMIVGFPLMGLLATHVGLARAAQMVSVVGLVCIVTSALAVRPVRSGAPITDAMVD